MGPVSSVNGAMGNTSTACIFLRQVLPTELRTHVGGHMQVACDFETRELLKPVFRWPPQWFAWEHHQASWASVGGQTKNAGLKSRVDAPLHFFLRFWTGSGSFNNIQFRTSQKMRGIELCFWHCRGWSTFDSWCIVDTPLSRPLVPPSSARLLQVHLRWIAHAQANQFGQGPTDPPTRRWTFETFPVSNVQIIKPSLLSACWYGFKGTI